MRWTSDFLAACYFPSARATSWRRAEPRLQAPPGRLIFVPCRLEAPARPRLGPRGCHWLTKLLVGPLGLLGDAHLLVAQRLDVVGVGGPRLLPFFCGRPGLQLHGARFLLRPTPAAPSDSRSPWSAGASTARRACGRRRRQRSDGPAARGCARRRRAAARAPWPPPRPPRPAWRGHGCGRPC